MQAAVRTAQEALVERTRFVLPAERWAEFADRLDRPAREIPALKRALSKARSLSAEALSGPEPLDAFHEHRRVRLRQPVAEHLPGAAGALPDERAEKARTYVVRRGGRVVGYFSLAAASVEPEDASARAAKGQGRQAVPAILLGRLAVDVREQGRGSARRCSPMRSFGAPLPRTRSARGSSSCTRSTIALVASMPPTASSPRRPTRCTSCC